MYRDMCCCREYTQSKRTQGNSNQGTRAHSPLLHFGSVLPFGRVIFTSRRERKFCFTVLTIYVDMC